MKIGELLRETRRDKGLTIGQAAKDLFIQEKYLQAIEEGNYEIIPGEVFLRAYFWKYADYLGLKEYIESLSQPPRLEPDRKEQSMNGIFDGEWDTARKIRVTLKLGLPILVIVLIIMGFNARNREPEQIAEPERHSGTRDQRLDVVPDGVGVTWSDRPAAHPGFADAIHALEGNAQVRHRTPSTNYRRTSGMAPSIALATRARCCSGTPVCSSSGHVRGGGRPRRTRGSSPSASSRTAAGSRSTGARRAGTPRR